MWPPHSKHRFKIITLSLFLKWLQFDLQWYLEPYWVLHMVGGTLTLSSTSFRLAMIRFFPRMTSSLSRTCSLNSSTVNSTFTMWCFCSWIFLSKPPIQFSASSYCSLNFLANCLLLWTCSFNSLISSCNVRFSSCKDCVKFAINFGRTSCCQIATKTFLKIDQIEILDNVITNKVTSATLIQSFCVASFPTPSAVDTILARKIACAKPPVFIAVRLKAYFLAFFCLSAGLFFLAAWNSVSDFNFKTCVRNLSANNWRADCFVKPSEYCTSLLTHLTSVEHSFIFSLMIMVSIFVLLSPWICGTSAFKLSYRAFASMTRADSSILPFDPGSRRLNAALKQPCQNVMRYSMASIAPAHAWASAFSELLLTRGKR